MEVAANGNASTQLQELLTEHEVARLLRGLVATLRRRRLLRQPPYPVRIGASVRYTQESIAAFVDDCQNRGVTRHRGIA